ncbi:MAG: diguanylate cyclase [Desulfuromonas sp.]|nr:diguanylate cyclase [Desulfuromonas sp.]
MESKNRVIITVSLLLICGFLLTSLTSYYTSLSSLRARIDQNELPLTSDNIYSEIQRDLLRPLFISSLMASDTFVREWVIQGEQDSEQMTRYLKEIMTSYGTFTSFFVSENTRTYYHADGILKRIDADEERDNWYFRVRDMEQDYEINIDPDLANRDSMTIFINYQVKDYAGKFIGATGVGLTVSAVKQLIEKYQRNYNRTIYFVTPEGEIAMHSSGVPDHVDCLADLDGVNALENEILANQQSSLHYQKQGETYHLNTRYIPEFNWHLVVEQSETAATRQLRTTLAINIAICAAITLIVLLINNLTISRYQRRIEKMALTDKLTGARNRQAFDLLLEQAIKELQRQPMPLSIILFDLDNFKQINDNYGHLAGDTTLKEVVEITQQSLRHADMLCRWGGEEFLIVLKQCSVEDAHHSAEKIRLAIQAAAIQHRQDTIHITASFGVIQYRAGENCDTMLHRADQALYIAKQNGKNRCEQLD